MAPVVVVVVVVAAWGWRLCGAFPCGALPTGCEW